VEGAKIVNAHWACVWVRILLLAAAAGDRRKKRSACFSHFFWLKWVPRWSRARQEKVSPPAASESCARWEILHPAHQNAARGQMENVKMEWCCFVAKKIMGWRTFEPFVIASRECGAEGVFVPSQFKLEQ
jgi:hypothetical protein